MATTRHPNEDAAEMQDAQERAVGISVFIRPDAPGFRCTVKQRYTDFLVNEILPNGETLHLTEIHGEQDKKRKREENGESSRKKQREDEAVPATEGAEKETEEEKANGQSNEAPAPVKPEIEATNETASASVEAVKAEAIASISDEDKSTLNTVFGEKTASSILNLYAAVVAFPNRKARNHSSVSSEPFAEKSKRTEAHMCIRRIFKSRLETITVQEQEHQTGPGTIIAIKAAPPASVHLGELGLPSQ